MKTFCFYDPQTGILTGQTYTGDSVETNTPPGLEAIEGLHDHTSRRIDIARYLLVDWSPPLDLEALTNRVRADRDRRLASCDWVALRALDSDKKVEAAWRDYRAALRDITKQDDFPHSVKWPGLPAAD